MDLWIDGLVVAWWFGGLMCVQQQRALSLESDGMVVWWCGGVVV
jgi:hypothetical protein